MRDPDWCRLHPELVLLISEKIAFLEHYVRFRSVCRPWRLACPPGPRHLIGQFAWLLSHTPAQNPGSATLSLYGFSKSRIHSFNHPDPIYGNICGSSHGWIVLKELMELSLINPITGERKNNCFPSFASPPNILGFARNERYNSSQAPYNPVQVLKVILTSSPTDKDCIAVAQFPFDWELAFARIGDTRWTILKLREYHQDNRNIVDFKCKKDSVYAIDEKGCVTIYGLRDLSKNVTVNNLTCENIDNYDFNIILGKGELDGLPIIVKSEKYWRRENLLECPLIEVFKCVNEPFGSGWTRVRNIGDYVLFLLVNSNLEGGKFGNLPYNYFS